MAYRDVFVAKGFQHLWECDGNVNDSIGAANGTNTGGILTRPAIATDATNCYSTNGTGDRIVIPNTTDINNGSHERKLIVLWFNADQFIQFFTRIYSEGNTGTNQFFIAMGVGNSLTFEVRKSGVSTQAYSGSISIVPNRKYMLSMYISGTNHENILRAWIDNKLMTSYDGETNGQLNFTTLDARTPCEVGDPSGTVQINGTSIVQTAPVIGDWNYIGSLTGAAVTQADIDELFAEGAILSAEYTITSGTEANMQAQIDALNNTIMGNTPLSLHIQAVTGDGDLTLDSGTLTFNELAGLDIKYEGTGTLTWRNTDANASTFYGNVSIENPRNLTINFTQTATEVRIYDDDGVNAQDFGTELAGIESSAGTSFVYSHAGTTNAVVVQLIKENYEEERRRLTLTNSDQTLTITQVFDTNL